MKYISCGYNTKSTSILNETYFDGAVLKAFLHNCILIEMHDAWRLNTRPDFSRICLTLNNGLRLDLILKKKLPSTIKCNRTG